jgi:hypothetical protein
MYTFYGPSTSLHHTAKIILERQKAVTKLILWEHAVNKIKKILKNLRNNHQIISTTDRNR